MTPEQMQVDFKRKLALLKTYSKLEFPNMAERKALRFIAGNFAAQGYQGQSFQRWKDNKKKTRILWKRGNLARSNRAQKSDGAVRIYNDAIYARVHNEGMTIQHPARQSKITFKSYVVNCFQLFD